MIKDSIKILITGDYHVTNKMADHLEKRENPAEVFGDFQALIKNTDIAITNIEFPLTTSDNQYLKVGMTAKARPSCLRALKDAGFTIASIGNNHSYDYRTDGIKDTISNCTQYGLDTVGADVDYESSRRILYKEVKGKKIAFLNFAENEFSTSNAYRGGANPLDLIENVRDIRTAKANADYVIVIVHGGPDFSHYPNPSFVKQNRFYAEEGASAIVCHHTHWVSSYERHQGVPIFYGLGNFTYPIENEIQRNETLVLELELMDDRIDYVITPGIFNVKEMRLELIKGDRRIEFNQRMIEINKALTDPQLLKEKWGEYIEQEKIRYLVQISNIPNIIFKVLRKLHLQGLLRILLFNGKLRYISIWNIIRCEHHRDAILYIFDEMFKDYNHQPKKISKFKKLFFNVSVEETR
jgi:poly-gamma-glutamate synthesis protein (capsule biosynthesis protein)